MLISKSLLSVSLLGIALAAGCEGNVNVNVDRVALGKLIYFDTNLSNPAGQSCASCHSPEAAFADPDRDLPVSRGVRPWLTGNRNSPTAAYCTYAPEFHYDATEQLYVGGMFWDGRAKNLVEQAKGPFLNPLEMGNTDEAMVVGKVKQSNYADLFRAVWGDKAFDDVKTAYHHIAEAIAAYEGSTELNRFTSKYDFSLKGAVQLTAEEKNGMQLFADPKKGNCAACHPHTAAAGQPILFTDFTYDNLGVPKNPKNPFYELAATHNPDGAAWIDKGLGGALKDPAEDGKFKVPTLRNIAVTGPYMHNGVFDTLEEVVEFYSTRDVDPKWGAPEVAANMNKEELGDLKLTPAEVAAIVAFMKTLTDGYVPPGK